MAVRSWLKQKAKILLRKCGYEVSQACFSESAHSLTLRLAKISGANIFLDVGANEGQFATSVLDNLPSVMVYSFEPGSEAHSVAVGRASGYPHWIVHERVAVGASSGELTLNVAENSVSSSLLDMARLHRHAAPSSVYVGTEKVKCEPLDNIIKDNIESGPKFYLKIDTQGYEMNVLLGATATLERTVAVQCEVSFEELYKEQVLAHDIVAFLKARNFVVFGYSNGLRDPDSHQLLQADIYFIREKSST